MFLRTNYVDQFWKDIQWDLCSSVEIMLGGGGGVDAFV